MADLPMTKAQLKAENTLQTKHCIALIILEIIFIVLYSQFTEYSDEVAAGQAVEQTIDRYYPMYQDVHVMIFIGFGFLMTFMKRYGFSAIGFNFLLAALTIQYSILINGFWHRVFENKWDHKITLNITSLITGDFAAGAVLISFGAVLGKATVEQLVLMMIFEIMFYAINESIGVIEYMAVDMGGSMYVHTFGAYFGLGVASMLTQKPKLKRDEHMFGASYTSDMTAMIGTIFLWMFWPSFNGALAEGAQQHRVVINTVLALTNSCVAAFLMSKMLRPNHMISMVDIQNATLAGGVAVGSSADLVIGPYASLIIGFVAGSLSVVGYIYVSPRLEKWGIHDTCGVHNLHGMPGVLGGISGAISAASATEKAYGQDISAIFAGMAKDGEDRSAGEQGGFQAAALVTTLAIAFFGGMITGFFMRMQDAPRHYGMDDDAWEIEEEHDEAEHHEPLKPVAPVTEVVGNPVDSAADNSQV